MRWMFAAAAVAAALSAHPARACECAAPQGPVSPPDGATGLPVNAVLVFDTSLVPVSSIALAKNGTAIPLVLETHADYVIARPASPLAANTTYTVTTTRATAITTTFTTGSAADHVAPSFAGASAVTLEVMGPVANPGSACANCDVHAAADGSTTRIHFAFADPPADAVALGVQLFIPGDEHPLVDAAFVPSNWDRTIDFHGCRVIAPELTPGLTYCAQVIAYDAAGNAAGVGQPCAMPTQCVPQFDATDCAPADTCTPIDGVSGGDAGTPTDEIGGSKHAGCAAAPGAAPWLLVLAALAWPRRRRS